MLSGAATLDRGGSPLAAARRLWRHRELLWEFTKRDVRDRYAGHVLGAAWALGSPLLLMGLYVVVFTFVFRVRLGGPADLPRDFTVYILAGLVPWLTFQEVLVRACTAITANHSLVKQIVFPVEILPVKVVLGSFLAQLVSLGVVLAYLLLTGNPVPATIVLVVPLCALQLVAMVGAAYALAAAGVFLRDIKDVVTVFNAANLFLQPILYRPEQVPGPLRALIYANPFSHQALAFQDALYHGTLEHPWSWVAFAAGALLALAGGYALFRRLAPYFGNVL